MDDVEQAIDELAAAGAGVIKMPVTGGNGLSRAQVAAGVDRAHARGLRVVTHAMGDAEAGLAAELGVDLLAHVPTGALSTATKQAWFDGAVVPTLAAFGGSPAAVDNLRALYEGGATVLYGTDFGNTRTAGVSEAELALMLEAGMSPEAVLAAATQAPAAYWGFSSLGVLEEGRAASFLVLSTDPLVDPTVLARPDEVWSAGLRLR